jgi:hypothetical protein
MKIGPNSAALYISVVLLFFGAAPAVSTSAQSPSPTPQVSPSPSLEKEFVKNVFRDQKAIWLSPFHLDSEDARWLVPLSAASVALFATDRRTANAVSDNGTKPPSTGVSHQISRIGSIYSTVGVAGAFYVSGVATHNWRARETGILGGEALVDSMFVATVVKTITQRPRPTVPDPNDDFFNGGHSFPSGHATAAWSLAAVVASEYNDKPAVQITAYGLATAVAISRFTGRNHFLSDVLAGSALGYGVGKFVYHKHHIDESQIRNGAVQPLTKRSRWIPTVVPLYARAERAYGVRLAW